MAFWRRLLGRGEQPGISEAISLAKSQALARNGRWAASLWWSAKALEEDASSMAARDIFRQAFTNAYAQFASRSIQANKKRVAEFAELIQERHRRDLTDDEARGAADALAAGFCLELVVREASTLADRISTGAFEASPSKDDITTAYQLAAACAGVIPEGSRANEWTSILSVESQQSVERDIALLAESLALLLQPSTPTAFKAACQRAERLWSGLATDDAQMIRRVFAALEDVETTEENLEHHRGPFEQQVARDLAQFLWLREFMKRPA